MTVVRQDTNLNVPAVPPTLFWPSAAGIGIPANVVGFTWAIDTNTPGYSAGSVADLMVQYLYGSSWTDAGGVGGFALGPHTGKVVDSSGGVTFQTVTTNELTGTINPSTSGVDPSAGRIRIDQIPSGTIASLTLSVSS